MQTKWAEENLQTIRTLMERSALYRRALAPVMIWCGIVGIVGGISGCVFFKGDSVRTFILFWTSLALVCLSGSFFLARRQALNNNEPFWTPPTRRVAQSLSPCFFVGFVIGLMCALTQGDLSQLSMVPLIMVWAFMFGCAANSASFFVARGMRYFGWAFILAGCLINPDIIDAIYKHLHIEITTSTPHLLMGLTFGGLHLAYGIYLYFTEKKNPVA